MHSGMTVSRGESAKRVWVPLVIMVTLMLGGCGTADPTTSAAPGASPSPTPTVACPQIEGVELAPECAPYDPDHAMAQNERHHQRMDPSAESRDAATEVVNQVRAELEELRASGALSTDAVQDVLEAAGLAYPQVQGDSRSVEFGVDGPEGGCVFGSVSRDYGVSVEFGGYVSDGGCLAQDGH